MRLVSSARTPSGPSSSKPPASARAMTASIMSSVTAPAGSAGAGERSSVMVIRMVLLSDQRYRAQPLSWWTLASHKPLYTPGLAGHRLLVDVAVRTRRGDRFIDDGDGAGGGHPEQDVVQPSG